MNGVLDEEALEFSQLFVELVFELCYLEKVENEYWDYFYSTIDQRFDLMVGSKAPLYPTYPQAPTPSPVVPISDESSFRTASMPLPPPTPNENSEVPVIGIDPRQTLLDASQLGHNPSIILRQQSVAPPPYSAPHYSLSISPSFAAAGVQIGEPAMPASPTQSQHDHMDMDDNGIGPDISTPQSPNLASPRAAPSSLMPKHEPLTKRQVRFEEPSQEDHGSVSEKAGTEEDNVMEQDVDDEPVDQQLGNVKDETMDGAEEEEDCGRRTALPLISPSSRPLAHPSTSPITSGVESVVRDAKMEIDGGESDSTSSLSDPPSRPGSPVASVLEKAARASFLVPKSPIPAMHNRLTRTQNTMKSLSQRSSSKTPVGINGMSRTLPSNDKA